LTARPSQEAPPPAGLIDRLSRRRSIVQVFGGWRRMLTLLAVLLAGSAAYDLGWLPDALALATPAVAQEPAAAPKADDAGAEAAEAHAEAEGGGHTSPVTPVLLAIILILVLAKTGGDLFERVGMPAVLGELTVGIILGNFLLITGSPALEPFFHLPDALPPMPAGQSAAEYARHLFQNPAPAAVLAILAEIGVILLLFEVGLESTVREMLSVGVSSLLVAVLGVVAPMLLGWGVGIVLLPHEPYYVHMFIGATLCATSVGITARVLKDLGRSKQRESQIILGAAVIDDVLGLVVLAVVVGIIHSIGRGDEFSAVGVVKIMGLAAAFLIGSVILGVTLFTRPLFKAASYLRGHGLLVVVALVICFGFAWLAAQVGLATIVGAFAAGLILERAQYRELGAKEDHELEDALAPLTALLVPIFFVQMGTKVDLASFAKPSVWGLAAAVTMAAIIGKQICVFGVREKGLNRLAVGLGMIPRGEVGLIFAAEGAKLAVQGERVITPDTYSAIVVMVMITTMVTPPLLKWAMTRRDGARDEADAPRHAEPAPER
jgi:Kef-type K+ transport system membrane component KefB